MLDDPSDLNHIQIQSWFVFQKPNEQLRKVTNSLEIKSQQVQMSYSL